MQLISFEDYVDALDDDAAAPKEKLKEIVEKQKQRATAEAKAAMMQQETLKQQQLHSDKLNEAAALIQKLINENVKLKQEKGENNNGVYSESIPQKSV
jgi:regulator of protease activity HflC (stomatin/prohibitin superfamily)